MTDFWEEVALQLVKDFRPHLDYWLERPLPQDKISLATELQPTIDRLLHSDAAYLKQIVYRVDITEQRLGSILANLEGANAVESLTHEMIRREELKVQIRRSYGKGKLE